jgi:hypothetical protein
VSQESTNRSFDDLARAMAEGSLSRRRALKLFAGTALAALIPSRALADDDCVRVCHVPFDRATEECEFAKAERVASAGASADATWRTTLATAGADALIV